MPQVQGFEPVNVNGEQQLTLVVQSSTQDFDPRGPQDTIGIILNHRFEEIKRVSTQGENVQQDFHKCNLDTAGKTVILAARFSEEGESSRSSNCGFQEIDLATGNVTFQ